MGSKADVKWRVLGAALVVTTLAYPSVGAASGYLAGREVDLFLLDAAVGRCRPEGRHDFCRR